ncbi:hypothetical protein [Streptomyces californicus]|uniref:hypothetical protein n=1 Tax=Streptomyces californicus TaxID=67351 RepID=UPI00296E77F9|nr:hypothetical protein [Streptomyces californicus]MDW4912516.1 hypothetical protein [Streptomyces californicus]
MTDQTNGEEMVVELGRTTDRPDTKFATVPEWVLRECRSEVWLYAELSLLQKGSVVDISLANLAALAGVSIRTLQKNIAALREAGAISVKPRHDDNNNRLPNLYVLNLTPPAGVKLGG